MNRGTTEHLPPPRALCAVLVATGILGVGCGDEPPTAPGNPEPPGYTDPSALVLAHAQALTSQDYAKYEKLLAEDFEYFPQAEDLTDFPWLQGGDVSDFPWLATADSWGRTEELRMIGHMFDDDFKPADSGAVGTMGTINAQMTVWDQRVEPDGSRVVDANAIVTVMSTSGDRALSDVRLEFHLITGPDGYLRIRSIHEKPLYAPGPPDEPAVMSWARLKGSFWEGIAP